MREQVSFRKVDGEIIALPAVEQTHVHASVGHSVIDERGLSSVARAFFLRSISPQKRGLHSLHLRHHGSVGQMIWIFCGWVMVCGLLLKSVRK